MKKHVPNFITCLNLFTGCVALGLIMQQRLAEAALMTVLAAAFDFLDGLAARVLKAYSPLGKDLDSLADAISFGLVPGAILYQLMQQTNYATTYPNEFIRTCIQYTPFFITVFSVLRLAKFNNDTRQTTSFIGLPTPANAMLIGSIPLMMTYHPETEFVIFDSPEVLILITLVQSWLLVAEIPLFSLKFKHYRWKENEVRYVFISLSALLLAILYYMAIPIIIFLYILISLLSRGTSQPHEKV